MFIKFTLIGLPSVAQFILMELPSVAQFTLHTSFLFPLPFHWWFHKGAFSFDSVVKSLSWPLVDSVAAISLLPPIPLLCKTCCSLLVQFTSVELYQAYADYTDMMSLTEELIRAAALAVCSSLQV